MVIITPLLSVNQNYLDYGTLRELSVVVLRTDGKVHAAYGNCNFKIVHSNKVY